MKNVLNFLEDLKANNQREWYHANKERYTATRKSFSDFVQQVIELLQPLDPTLTGLQAKDAMFRIFRDVRFSNDKTPYKTHYSAFIARGGRKGIYGGYYFHVGVNDFFLAAGVHTPAKENLDAIRKEILYRPDEYRKLVNDRLELGYSTYEEDKLKKGPVGYDKEDPNIDLVKYKHYLLSTNLSKSQVLSPDFLQLVVDHFKTLQPYNAFINTALEFKGNQ